MATSRERSFASSPSRIDRRLRHVPQALQGGRDAPGGAALPLGLADFADETLAFNAAERCFNEFRNQDGAIVLGILSRNATTGPSVWRFFTSRWQEAIDKFPANTLTRLVLGVPTFIKDPIFADQVAAFHESHPISGEQRIVDQAIERMRVGLTFAPHCALSSRTSS